MVNMPSWYVSRALEAALRQMQQQQEHYFLARTDQTPFNTEPSVDDVDVGVPAEFSEDWLDEGDHMEMAYRRISAKEYVPGGVQRN